jgi:phosphoglycerate dehydrogenase-like enzyme
VPAGPGEPAFTEAYPHAHVFVGWPDLATLAQARALQWIALPSAGADRFAESVPESILLTDASGTFGIPIAEHILAMMLAFVREIPRAVRKQETREWHQGAHAQELSAATCAVIGLGDIGRETARRAKAFGMRVIATKRTPAEPPPYVDELFLHDQLDAVLAQADHVVVTLPGTRHTRHTLDARRLALMKPSAYVYNVGRGSTLDQAALIAALQAKRLAGAGLDVFDPEPLPADSPLWAMDNVIISPHRSGQSPHNAQRFADILLRNFACFLQGEPLHNLVDRQWCY